ncbi:HAMP domain-containing sensor histidine kinase [Aminicella lysinilytica]|uniref:HAMP domain-containing sensor histidine kinase n=1 Tax=Aminicella lysinilytica TaxID=433323 RepID=UPI0026EA7200|nr:HAMP domain-containing sensor histidine kinase [Aminicella lysinilytica]
MSNDRSWVNFFTNKRFLSLNFKLAVAIIVAALLATGTLLGCNLLENQVADKMFLSKSAKTKAIDQKYSDLTAYIGKHDVKATDTAALKKWMKDEDYMGFIVYDNNGDLFSAGWITDTGSNAGSLTGDSNAASNRKDAATSDKKERIDASKFKSDLYNRIVKFADGDYYVFINVYKENYWYSIMNIVKILLSAMVFLLAILVYNSFVLRRVITLSDDVRKISEGDLKRNIATVHNDEIGKLAGSVDTMRNAILEKMDNEKAAWDANTQLITSMSHDIRTPLTSLIGYLDIIEGKKFNSYEELDKYIASCREKAFQLKDLSDKLFQYFLVFGNKDQGKNMEKLDAGILFQQILVEHVAEAISYGNNINLQYNIPEQIMVETDISSLRRLFDNLFSNIMKYANTKFAVEVKADVIRDKIKIVLQNHIWDEAKKVESTKIGVKTCKKICEDMNGTFKAMEEEKIYTTEILFPIVEGDEEEPEDEASANGTAEASEYKS